MVGRTFFLLSLLLLGCEHCVSFIFGKVQVGGSSSARCTAMAAALQNDLIIRAALGKKVEKVPIWIFRQAGRHLPEYNDYKEKKGKNFLQLLDDPVDVAECTMQPIRRYNLDAAILFSDILVILQAVGMEVTMPGGVGIQVPTPLASPAEVASRIPATIDVKEKLAHVIKAVSLIKTELQDRVPLIGFSAAPWTLMYYMVGGSSKKNQQVALSWLENHPVESKKLLRILTTIIIDYASAQIDAGADLIQIFEAMGEFIDEKNFYIWALPCLHEIASALKKKHPGVPLLVFARGASYSSVDLQRAGYDVITLDTKSDRLATRQLLALDAGDFDTGRRNTDTDRSLPASLQGNLDVSLLEKGSVGGVDAVRNEVRRMIEDFGVQRYIANLGEGLTGKEDPELVAAFVDAVHEISAELVDK